MPNVSANIDTFLRSADNAAARTNLGVPALSGDTFTGPIVINGGTVTDSTPLLALSQTWNDVNDAFKALTVAVTNTASKAYSATWADVSTLMDLVCDGVTKFAVIPKGSENRAMIRIGGADATHALIKDSGTGAIIVRRSDAADTAALGWLGNGTVGLCVGNTGAGGVIGFNSTTNVMGGGNSSSDAFFMRAGAAASIQMGANSATPIDQLFKGPNGSGTNIAAGDLRIGPGQSTGNATPATVVLQGTAAGASGTAAQTLVDVLTINSATLVSIASGAELQLGNAAASGSVVPTHTLTVRDSTGTTYRIPCLI